MLILGITLDLSPHSKPKVNFTNYSIIFLAFFQPALYHCLVVPSLPSTILYNYSSLITISYSNYESQELYQAITGLRELVKGCVREIIMQFNAFCQGYMFPSVPHQAHMEPLYWCTRSHRYVGTETHMHTQKMCALTATQRLPFANSQH